METDRLLLREVVLEDDKFILALLSDPLWQKFIAPHSIDSVIKARDYIRERLVLSYQKGYGLWVVVVKELGIPVGICGLLKRDYLDDVDLGYAFLESFRGLGYAHESSKAVLRILAPKISTGKVLAMTHPGNSASISLLNKLGFRFLYSYQKPDCKDIIQIYRLEM
ncbi:GNAT family N-acetyltransferase [Motiliproteus sp. MSK22-1]|uniref:GNAT family N-acetyltransferase n=1 Tax=Motiliproteus sp. MSK22-1 TaxID=1897630 RepID=UPI0013018BCA|nr:GNAT family N-acetyltransferase [Motiliproteus sp. MSK22-1]